MFRSSKSTNNFINVKTFAVLPEAYAPFDPIVDSLVKTFLKIKMKNCKTKVSFKKKITCKNKKEKEKI